MLDRAFRLLTRSYWSVFFVVGAVTVPLQIAYATIWNDVIAVADLHGDIEQFPPLRQVHGVGRAQLGHARTAFWIIWAAEILLIPLFVRATQRILEVDRRGGVSGAVDGWRHSVARGLVPGARRALSSPGPLLVAAAVAAGVFLLVTGIGRVVIEPLGDERAFAGVGLVDGVARAAAAPFFLVVAAVAAHRGASQGTRE